MVDRYVGVRYREPPLPPHWGNPPPYHPDLLILSAYQQSDQTNRPTTGRQGNTSTFNPLAIL